MDTSAIASPASASIPLALIDPPEHAMRETMSDDGLESLTASLQALGQLQELVVVTTGDRYRIAAGHRRRVALERAGFATARCFVYPEGTPLEEAIKVAENDEREDVNPAAQATYYHWLLEHRAGGDVAQLTRLVNRKESHVLDRLDLIRGAANVRDALRAESISLAVARELNKVKLPNYRNLFLEDAITQGANSTTVRHWRQNLERTQRINEASAAAGDTATSASIVSPYVNIDECPLCHSAADQHDMEYVRVHRSCRAVFSRQQSAGERPGA